MRIVDVCAFYTPAGGGVRTYVEAKLRAASRLGHELIVLAPGARDEIVQRSPGTFLATLPAPFLPLDPRYRYFDDESAIHRALDRWRPDHVEVSSPWSSAGKVARWQGGATRSLVMHCDPLAAYAYRWFGRFMPSQLIDRLFGRFWRHLLHLDSMFDLVVCANEELTRRLGRGGLAKAETLPMGVERGIFSASLRSAELRADALHMLGLGHDAVLLIGIGRLSAEKRWEMVVRAVAELAPRVGLLLLGDGPRRRALEQLAERAPNIRLLGPVTDRPRLARLLASSDALVHGCEAETFCMVAAEARSSGIPLILPDRGAAADQLIRGAGVFYRAASRPALEQAICDFIARGPELQRMRATLHSDVRTMDEHFDELFARYARLRPGIVPLPSSFAEPVTMTA